MVEYWDGLLPYWVYHTMDNYRLFTYIFRQTHVVLCMSALFYSGLSRSWKGAGCCFHTLKTHETICSGCCLWQRQGIYCENMLCDPSDPYLLIWSTSLIQLTTIVPNHMPSVRICAGSGQQGNSERPRLDDNLRAKPWLGNPLLCPTKWAPHLYMFAGLQPHELVRSI